MKKTYLFSFCYSDFNPNQYILIYAINADEAKKIACKNLFYYSGKPAKEDDLILCTFGLDE